MKYSSLTVRNDVKETNSTIINYSLIEKFKKNKTLVKPTEQRFAFSNN